MDRPKTKKTRSRSGCFTCRVRKKKCSERRPDCVACVRNKLKCVYPTKENEKVPSNFVLEQKEYHEPLNFKKRKLLVATKDEKVAQDLFGVIVLNNYTGANATRPRSPNTSTSSSSSSSDSPDEFINSFNGDSNALIPMEYQAPLDPSIPSIWSQSSLLAFGRYIPNMELSIEDSELYSHCAKNYMSMVALPHSHPSLTPANVWVRLAAHSPILADVYLSCGAAYLACVHNENNALSLRYHRLAEAKYNSAVKTLTEAFNNGSVDLDSDWLMVAGLNLCLRDRAYGMNGSRCSKHIVFVYNLICRRVDKKDQDSPATPEERLLMESFIFNYTTALMTCSRYDMVRLPTPYELFLKLNRWLINPIVRDYDVEWVNNPVLGSALGIFQVMAKLCYLLRCHFEKSLPNEKDKFYMNDGKFWSLILPLKEEIRKIEIKNFERIQELDALKVNGQWYFSLRSNLAVSIITVNACKILVEKLINPSIPAFLPQIQEAVQSTLHELDLYIPSDNYSSSVSFLSLFICGSAIINRAQEVLFSEGLANLENDLSKHVAVDVVKVLQRSWERERLERMTLGDKGFKSFDLVFDRLTLESFAF
ncbi:hypothetical protein Cantr_00750 [Candida viswanathii]|uniref:Zn(2)-C6 fungal-type domain-containing protein n=1 Tax=Candida viswanathii TaxID=5486 RepID=A0A367YJR1_9ASCO|nr:hypothetical protein Cantr_00750 [Candida viswanathii]